jgi:hypothetical protein
VLQPDTYVIQHRTASGEHFVRFVELKKIEQVQPSGDWTVYTEANKAGELKCRVEPAPGPIKETTVYTTNEGGTPRITKVAIKGENVFHVF